ncbi:MFS transporter [Streptomyces sp. NBC_00094]|uniref:MFS transporter n=1 Tax=Streptomyces sp. NBC_00094 TaxID=2903620 RepID=UPI0022519401|nr:MFS transporter [Streptomyces sp. NBC_00094]MCX5393305.1 MFS transporter [Streptomyces sp. NBC_00094]
MTLTASPGHTAGPGPSRAGRREWAALCVLMLPLLLVSMDVSVLYFAIPSISADLRPGATEQLWILDTYGFVLAGLLVTMGALGDRVGRRRLLLGGAALFGVASVAAAYAHTPGALIAARALLGLAGACLMPTTLALIRTLFRDPAQRAKAVTLWTSVMASGISLGPVVSGALVEHFWWGSVFLVNLPAMALLLVLGPLLLPESKGAATPGPFDLASAGLSLAALLPLIHGIKELAKDGWAPLPVLGVAGGLILAGVFVRRQRRIAHPMVDLALIRTRAYGGSVLVNLLAMVATVGFAVFLTQYLQSVLGQSPLEAALWSLVPTLGVLVAAPTAAALARRVDRAYVMGGGFLVSAGGFAWMAGVDRATPLWVVLVACALYAAGLVSAMTLANELALGAAPPERAGAAAAVLESGQELGGALGMAILGSIGAAVYTAAMPPSAPAAARETLGGALTGTPDVLDAARSAFTEAMSGAAVGASLLMLVAAVMSVVLLRGRT